MTVDLKAPSASTLLEVADGLRWRDPALSLALTEHAQRSVPDGDGRQAVERSLIRAVGQLDSAAEIVARAAPCLRSAERDGRGADAVAARAELALAAVRSDDPDTAATLLAPTVGSDVPASVVGRLALARAWCCAARGDVTGADAQAAGVAPAGDESVVGADLVRARVAARRRHGDLGSALELLRTSGPGPSAEVDGGRRAAQATVDEIEVLLDLGHRDHARALATDFLGRQPSAATASSWARASVLLARRIHLPAREFDAAEACVRPVDADLRPDGHEALVAQAVVVRSEVAEARGDLARALVLRRRAHDLEVRARDETTSARLALVRAACTAFGADPEEAPTGRHGRIAAPPDDGRPDNDAVGDPDAGRADHEPVEQGQGSSSRRSSGRRSSSRRGSGRRSDRGDVDDPPVGTTPTGTTPDTTLSGGGATLSGGEWSTGADVSSGWSVGGGLGGGRGAGVGSVWAVGGGLGRSPWRRNRSADVGFDANPDDVGHDRSVGAGHGAGDDAGLARSVRVGDGPVPSTGAGADADPGPSLGAAFGVGLAGIDDAPAGPRHDRDGDSSIGDSSIGGSPFGADLGTWLEGIAGGSSGPRHDVDSEPSAGVGLGDVDRSRSARVDLGGLASGFDRGFDRGFDSGFDSGWPGGSALRRAPEPVRAEDHAAESPVDHRPAGHRPADHRPAEPDLPADKSGDPYDAELALIAAGLLAEYGGLDALFGPVVGKASPSETADMYAPTEPASPSSVGGQGHRIPSQQGRPDGSRFAREEDSGDRLADLLAAAMDAFRREGPGQAAELRADPAMSPADHRPVPR